MSDSAKIFAIVPAAGVGSRMQSTTPKQYLRLAGRAVLDHSISGLLNPLDVQHLVVCLAIDDRYWNDLDAAQISRVSTTLGGETRAHSVLNGLSSLSSFAAKNDWVLVHDAARPCLSEAAVGRLVTELVDHKTGGILAVPARDTLKLARDQGNHPIVDKTLPREQIWQAQTPQMFRYGLLESALAEALSEPNSVTDEASAMERAGHEVRLVEGDQSNIKITTAEDVLIARSMLEKTVQ